MDGRTYGWTNGRMNKWMDRNSPCSQDSVPFGAAALRRNLPSDIRSLSHELASRTATTIGRLVGWSVGRSVGVTIMRNKNLFFTNQQQQHSKKPRICDLILCKVLLTDRRTDGRTQPLPSLHSACTSFHFFL